MAAKTPIEHILKHRLARIQLVLLEDHACTQAVLLKAPSMQHRKPSALHGT